MAKNKISEWSSVPANNTDIGGIDIAEGCAPSGINNGIRELMAQVKDMITGADGDSQVVGGNLTVNGTTTLTGAVTAPAGVTGNLTGNVTGNLTGNVTGNTSGTAANVTGTVSVANGGTGLTTLTANNVMLGNGTSTPAFVAPSTSGNVLTSNGTTWTSAALPNQGIGVGQSWQQVTRNIGTTYTNDTGKPIMLIANPVRNAPSTAGLNCVINGVEVPLCYNTNSDGGNESVGSIIIPVSANYVLTVKGEGLSSYRVFELR